MNDFQVWSFRNKGKTAKVRNFIGGIIIYIILMFLVFWPFWLVKIN